MNIKKALGRAIAHHRELRGLTQKNVPEYDQGGLSKIENGKQGISVERLADVARAIGVPVSQIWDSADRLMRGESLEGVPSGLSALRKKAEAAPVKAQYHLALAAVVEGVISTTPDAKPALRTFLRKALAASSDERERELLIRLTNRLGGSLVQSPAKSSASRGRARAE